MTPRRGKDDPFSHERGYWIGGGWWTCDCKVNWPGDKYRCSRCSCRRPLVGSPIYTRESPLGGDHSFAPPTLRQVKP